MFNTRALRIIADKLIALAPSRLESRESMLQQWIWDDITLLGEPLLLIGREVATSYGGRMDLLAIDADAQVCVIELKRDRTPRNVLGQALDYASCVAELEWDALDEYSQSAFGVGLAERYAERFGQVLDESQPVNPRIIIVASQLDADSERIARFLKSYDVPINAVFFSTFDDGDSQVMTRSWMLDPADDPTPVASTGRKRTAKHPRSGYWFVNVGVVARKARTESTLVRSWDDSRRYGFLTAGGGESYRRQICNVAVGERVYAYLNEHGYVGLGNVVAAAVPIRDFRLADGRRLSGVTLESPQILDRADDLGQCEYVLGIEWEHTVPAEEAIRAGWHSIMTACEFNQPAALQRLGEFFERSVR